MRNECAGAQHNRSTDEAVTQLWAPVRISCCFLRPAITHPTAPRASVENKAASEPCSPQLAPLPRCSPALAPFTLTGRSWKRGRARDLLYVLISSVSKISKN